MLRQLITAVTINAVAFGSFMHVANAQLAQDETIRIRTEQHKFRTEELECLALNIYFETHATSLADAMAVSDVVLTRVASRDFPSTICAVVKEGYKPGSRACQFSWFCDGKGDTPHNREIWILSQKYASDIYNYGKYIGITEGSTHYHASNVKPYWAPTLDRVTRIGSHIFYRMKGKRNGR